jgi:hypothetical protein
MVQTDMDKAPQESAGGEDDRLGGYLIVGMCLYPFDLPFIDDEPVYHGLPYIQVRLIFYHRFHPLAVEVAIALTS